MSQEGTGAVTPGSDTAQDGEHKKQDETASEAQQHQQRQEAWVARRALITHGPAFVQPLAESATRIGGDQFGVSGGEVHGDVNFFGTWNGREHLSGEVPRERIERLSGVFCGCPSFEEAIVRLRNDRVVILSGGHDTGRSTAGMMLLSRLGVERMRSLDAPDSIMALPEQLDGPGGYLLFDLAVSRGQPLREPHLLGLRERLGRIGGHLVITVEPSAALRNVPYVRWEPPAAEGMLRSHVLPHTGETAWADLCGLGPVKEYLARPQQPSGIAEYARQLVAFHRGEIDEEVLAAYDEEAVDTQVSRMLGDDRRELREKAFLISLAVFDKAPYAVAAELGDPLYEGLQRIADPRKSAVIPVFGTPREERLRLAGAREYVGTEVTDWGTVVGQVFAEFLDERTAPALLHEVWNQHPSARPALVEWIEDLADDGRPLVRTRAASAAAQLATVDLSSTMAHLIEPWADDDFFGSWLTAANALTMAHLLSVPHVFEILHDWCTGEADSRRWTAIRAYGLLGPMRHEEALTALLDAAHRQPVADADHGGEEEDSDEGEAEEAKQLADALELLLLAVREPVLSELAGRLGADRSVRTHALLAFRQACKQSRDDDTARPAVLGWYAQAVTDGSPAASYLVAFWQALLADRTHAKQALSILRDWVLKADCDPGSETALASLLPALVTTRTNHRRVSHLLRTAHGPGKAAPPAARRLLQRISTTDPRGGRHA